MNINQQFEEDARRTAAAFSRDRHARLMSSLARNEQRPTEAKLRMPRDLWVGGGAIVFGLVAACGLWLNTASKSTSLMAENGAELARVTVPSTDSQLEVVSRPPDQTPAQTLASLAKDPASPFVEPADGAIRYFADQFALARALAIPAQAKTKT